MPRTGIALIFAVDLALKNQVEGQVRPTTLIHMTIMAHNILVQDQHRRLAGSNHTPFPSINYLRLAMLIDLSSWNQQPNTWSGTGTTTFKKLQRVLYKTYKKLPLPTSLEYSFGEEALIAKTNNLHQGCGKATMIFMLQICPKTKRIPASDPQLLQKKTHSTVIFCKTQRASQFGQCSKSPWYQDWTLDSVQSKHRTLRK